ncbi:MAG: hypothetical protein C4523_20685 [Myxococcales bacterium]|nr:MAG: hypothetical protein C4523_20685 [Myxococcales bacterium]
MLTAMDKTRLLANIVRWRLTWSRRDTRYRPADLDSHKFISAREAAQKIKDASVVFSCGMAGHARCSIFYWAIRECFEETGHPKGLTWINVGAQGGRGRVPGTIEELGFPGLITRYIVGHAETAKAQLKLAEEGQLELHTMGQAEMAFLVEGQAEGKTDLETTVGVGTFLDPRVGSGSAVSPNARENFIEPAGDKLRYRLPKIDVGIFSAPYADREGNIYFKHAATLTENELAAKAAKANGGLSLAAVGGIVEKNEAEIGIPAKYIDYVVFNSRNEQTGSVPQRRYWPMFTVGANVDVAKAVAELKYINSTLKITPLRGPVENALARLAASLFASEARPGATVNIGVGLPEEVCRLVYESGLYKDLIFTSETGVYGGLPAPGIFFGGAINPVRMENSAWMFRLYLEKLDVAVLGLLEADSEGNVNVSKRGPKLTDYVGPGGFPAIVAGAKTIIFVGSWMAHAKMNLKDGRLAIDEPGTPKFVDKASQITFSGKEGLRQGKRVYYVTNVGVFKLTPRGLELWKAMPGVDIQRDILQTATAKIVLPANGRVETVEDSIATGENFRLSWPE